MEKREVSSFQTGWVKTPDSIPGTEIHYWPSSVPHIPHAASHVIPLSLILGQAATIFYLDSHNLLYLQSVFQPPSHTLLFSCLKSIHGFPLEPNPKTFRGSRWVIWPLPTSWSYGMSLYLWAASIPGVQFPSLPFPASGPMHASPAISHQPFRSLSRNISCRETHPILKTVSSWKCI